MAVDAETTLNDLIGRVGRVRRWLLAISALRIAALGLASVSLYIGLYAWIDHHVHFGRLGRVSAFVLFASMLAAGLYYVVRVLRREMTYVYAANYVENRRSFDQQLVAAVEYYEEKGDYPYSQALARQLVLQVDRAAEGYRFDSTVAKWQGYLLSGFILLCLLIVGVFVRQNILYVSSYLARLVRPFSDVPTVAVTTLESTSGDLVTAPDVPVTLTAAVQGRMPKSATLVLTRREPNDANAPAGNDARRIDISPVSDAERNVALRATESFDRTGRFEYRFEAGDACSESHTITICEPPAVKSIMATISPPSKDGAPPVQPYEQPVTDQKLEVLPGSRIELKVQATMPLREASVAGPDGRQAIQPSNGADSFTFQLTADKPSSVRLSVVSSEGLSNSDPPELRIALKSDEPPQFKRLCPDGDYLATDVASIPILFEVTDDFGLDSAQLHCELPGRGPIVLQSASPQGSKQARLAHTLELEQYDLHVGDSILFYATAQDIDTGQRRAETNARSEVYLIEIRPYQQYWHPQPGDDKPSSSPGPVPEDLLTLLEYTRAILKKTWALAGAPPTAEGSRPTFETLTADVQHCARSLTKTRDDPDAGFSDSDKAVLDEILKSYEQASEHLARHDADAALPPVQNAYRTLRKLIDELHLKWNPPQTGQSAPQQTPERIKLQEQPQEPQMEKERLESRLKEMQQRIDALARQQQSLKADLTKALQQEKQSQSGSSSATQASSSRRSEGQSSDSGSPKQRAEKEESSPGTNQSAANGKNRDETAQQSSSAQSNNSAEKDGQSGQSQGSSGSTPAKAKSSAGQSRLPSSTPDSATGRQSSEAPSPGSTGGQPWRSSAEMDARLRMLQAKQQALRERTAQLREELGGLPATESSGHGNADGRAQEHLKQAIETMKQLEEKLADSRYGPPASSEGGTMPNLADAAARRLAEAGQAIQREISGDQREATAKQAQNMAEQLAKDAESYDESLSDAQKQQMAERLKAAEKLLESMAGPQWAIIASGGGPAAGHVYTKDAHAAPAEAARMMARQFWSLALEARQRQTQPMGEEPSDVEFFESEIKFFENAAKFRRQSVEK